MKAKYRIKVSEKNDNITCIAQKRGRRFLFFFHEWDRIAGQYDFTEQGAKQVIDTDIIASKKPNVHYIKYP